MVLGLAKPHRHDPLAAALVDRRIPLEGHEADRLLVARGVVGHEKLVRHLAGVGIDLDREVRVGLLEAGHKRERPKRGAELHGGAEPLSAHAGIQSIPRADPARRLSVGNGDGRVAQFDPRHAGLVGHAHPATGLEVKRLPTRHEHVTRALRVGRQPHAERLEPAAAAEHVGQWRDPGRRAGLAGIECRLQIGQRRRIELPIGERRQQAEFRRHQAKLGRPRLRGIYRHDLDAVQPQRHRAAGNADVGIGGAYRAVGRDHEPVVPRLDEVLTHWQVRHRNLQPARAADELFLIIPLEEKSTVDVGVADPERGLFADLLVDAAVGRVFGLDDLLDLLGVAGQRAGIEIGHKLNHELSGARRGSRCGPRRCCLTGIQP